MEKEDALSKKLRKTKKAAAKGGKSKPNTPGNKSRGTRLLTLTHLLTYLLTHSLLLTFSLTYLLTHSLTYLLTYSLNQVRNHWMSLPARPR